MRSSGGRQTYAAVFAMDLRSGERFKTSSGFAVYVCASADMFGVTYYYEGDEHRKPNTLSPYALGFRWEVTEIISTTVDREQIMTIFTV